jgi:hypothetical protein
MVAPVSKDTIFHSKDIGRYEQFPSTSSNTFGYRLTTGNSLHCTFSTSDYCNCITSVILFNILGSSYRQLY